MLDKKCFIIAEAGVNHNGDIEIAKKLIELAAAAGADAVKFQTFKAENLVTSVAPKANYQKATTGEGNQLDMLRRLELTFEEHLIIKKHCQENGIMFISTPFDFQSAELLEKLDVLIYKVSSGDLTNLPLLRHIAKFGKPMIISTGMANLAEVETAIRAVVETGNSRITLLHCTSNYPTSYEDVNLNAMITLKNAFKLPIGYSDHTSGIEIPIAAVAMGAEVIEKHFTIDKNLQGPDHRASLNPVELKQMVEGIRNIEKAFGNGVKRCNKNEENTKLVARKSIVAAVDIKAGEKLSLLNLAFKRPENGLSPVFIDCIIGKKLNHDVCKDQLITLDLIV